MEAAEGGQLFRRSQNVLRHGALKNQTVETVGNGLTVLALGGQAALPQPLQVVAVQCISMAYCRLSSQGLLKTRKQPENDPVPKKEGHSP